MPPAAPTTTAPATSGQALQQMTQAQGQMQDPSAIMQGEQQNLGVPQAQQQVSGLRQAIANTTNLLNNVTPSVEGRTANSLVTSAQANREIQNESAPIAKTLSDQTTKEAQSSSDLKDLMSQASNNANLKIQGQDQKLSFLKNVYDALFNKEQSAATQSLEQQKLAEQVRESNQSNQLERDKLTASQANGGMTPYEAAQLANDAAKGYKVQTKGIVYDQNGNPTKAENTANGYNFIGPNNQPITMAQYIAGSGKGSGDVLGLLQNGTAYDKAVYSKVKGLSGDALQAALQKYPVYGF